MDYDCVRFVGRWLWFVVDADAAGAVGVGAVVVTVAELISSRWVLLMKQPLFQTSNYEHYQLIHSPFHHHHLHNNRCIHECAALNRHFHTVVPFPICARSNSFYTFLLFFSLLSRSYIQSSRIIGFGTFHKNSKHTHTHTNTLAQKLYPIIYTFVWAPEWYVVRIGCPIQLKILWIIFISKILLSLFSSFCI